MYLVTHHRPHLVLLDRSLKYLCKISKLVSMKGMFWYVSLAVVVRVVCLMLVKRRRDNINYLVHRKAMNKTYI